MDSHFVYLCFFALIIPTYTIPAKSKYIYIIIIFIVKFFYTSLLWIFRVTQFRFQFLNIDYFSGYFMRWETWKILLRNFPSDSRHQKFEVPSKNNYFILKTNENFKDDN